MTTLERIRAARGGDQAELASALHAAAVERVPWSLAASAAGLSAVEAMAVSRLAGAPPSPASSPRPVRPAPVALPTAPPPTRRVRWRGFVWDVVEDGRLLTISREGVTRVVARGLVEEVS